ncbi:MAG: hypothetical protein LUE27_00380 [Clostridia bacterium]|nr:hypothetical protein [Clostridia bacterium]
MKRDLQNINDRIGDLNETAKDIVKVVGDYCEEFIKGFNAVLEALDRMEEYDRKAGEALDRIDRLLEFERDLRREEERQRREDSGGNE